MTFLETRVELDKLLQEAESIKNGPTSDKSNAMIDDLRAILAKLVEMSEPSNEVHGRVCGNREIEISNLESALAKSKGKAIKAAAKRTKKPPKI